MTEPGLGLAVPYAEKQEVPIAEEAAIGGDFLQNVNGVIFRQDAYASALLGLGIPCVKANRFNFAPFPAGRRALRSLADDEGWSPSQEEFDSAAYTIIAQESSVCGTNCMFYLLGCVHFRPFTMEVGPTDTQGQLQGVYQLERPFTCGGFLCRPHNIELRKNGQVIGKVIEDWDCSNYCCRYFEAAYCCRVPYKLQLIEGDKLVDRYNITYNFACFGDHNNCCGGTPLRPNMLFNIYNYNEAGVDRSAAAGHVQKTFGNGCDLESLLRFCCNPNQYLSEWPTSSTEDEKALFMASSVLMEYIFFEFSGNSSKDYFTEHY